ncbi:MAG: HAMP domain-containing sensor histidine kinase [Cyclobacteriaceae bacterium]
MQYSTYKPGGDSILTKGVVSDGFLSSFQERRKKLAVNLIIIQFVICCGYLVYLAQLSTPFSSFFMPTLLTTTIITVSLWVMKKFQSAIIFDLVALNVMLFFLSERVTVMTGVDLFYVAVGSATIALFGYEYWKAGVGFSLLSLTLFLSSRFFSFESISIREFNPQQEQVFFLINSIASSLISMYSVITVMKLNFETQKRLQQIKTTVEEQNLELTKANEELDRFVYSASHDLRSPLSSIKGLVNVFGLDSEGKKEEYLPKITDRISTMDKFIKEITDYSRNSRIQVSLEYVLLLPIVNEIILSTQYADNADKIFFNIEVDEDFVIRSDEYRIKIILNNLITNAIKYSDLSKDKPSITIRASKEGNIAVIQIIDNGIGIRPEFVDKIFNMFYRATEESTGSGLGLYIVSESIKKLKGTIDVESEIGRGSSFILRLPQNNSLLT